MQEKTAYRMIMWNPLGYQDIRREIRGCKNVTILT
jgi:hypothetical protein